ncbi:hypothetical protein V6N12_031273 [Hibiscus sabdariffa]|uniref:RRM domain-containing protein n=1 Tax=Hibiscus sabdariffa TaxID=183260 RepID=A0ABR2E8J0_9ROSI
MKRQGIKYGVKHGSPADSYRRSRVPTYHRHPHIIYSRNTKRTTPSCNGVSDFVNFMSKMIHPLTLKETFSEYGSISDVYIAYNNPSRRNKTHTFAFVKFHSRVDALKAINLGNGGRMDGFTIRVYMGKYLPKQANVKELKIKATTKI